jgi:hypothetical protein
MILAVSVSMWNTITMTITNTAAALPMPPRRVSAAQPEAPRKVAAILTWYEIIIHNVV